MTAAADGHIGFIGLGNMGGPMACNLARAGLPVWVHDREPARGDEPVSLGARPAASVEELARRCATVHVCVVDAAQVRAVLFGEDGLAAHTSPGLLVVLHSTLSHEDTLAIAAEAAARGIALLDAPVSGGERGSRAGTLTFFAGGEAAHLERCRPALEVMGAQVFHLGPVGAGTLGKLVNNAVALTNQVMAREGLALAHALGLDEVAMRTALESGTADSWSLRHSWAARVWRGEARIEDYTTGAEGLAAVLRKDLRGALDAAHAAGVELPLTATALQGVTDLYRPIGEARG